MMNVREYCSLKKLYQHMTVSPTLHSSLDSKLSVSSRHLDLNNDKVYAHTLAQHGVFDALLACRTNPGLGYNLLSGGFLYL